jgi:5-methylcytosine-specific restriction endonuclease McrA
VKKCSKCQQSLELSAFYKNKARFDGYQNYCKVCGYEAHKNYVKNNRSASVERVLRYKKRHPEQAKVSAARTRLKYKDKWDYYARIYRQTHLKEHAERQHRRRALMQNNGVYFISDKEIKKLYSSSCFYCGSKDQITLDHIIPIIKGGTHSIGNLTAACKSCNSSKHKDFLTVWKKRKATIN